MPITRFAVDSYLRDAAEILGRIDTRALDAVVDVLFEAWERRRTVYSFGNGGSAATAQHLAADLFKGTIVAGKPRLRALCLNDNLPLLSALTNDEGWDEVYVQQLRTWWAPGDVAFALSVHGGAGAGRAGPWSRNVVAAMRWAVDNDGKALALVGFDGGELADICTAAVVVPVESTPHIEGLHVVLHHLITAALRDRIERA